MLQRLFECLANYEGWIDSGLAPCLSLDLDADTANPRSYSGAARPLCDIGGCYFNNNGSGTRVPAQFIDSADVGVDIYPAYGVTSSLLARRRHRRLSIRRNGDRDSNNFSNRHASGDRDSHTHRD